MLKGLGNLANLGQMMQQAQEMGAKMKEMQEELRGKKVTGAGGGGMVEVDMNGHTETLAVRIDPTLMDKGDREMIEDLVRDATNDAVQKAKQLHTEAMQQAAGGLNLPGLGDMLGQLGGGQ